MCQRNPQGCKASWEPQETQPVHSAKMSGTVAAATSVSCPYMYNSPPAQGSPIISITRALCYLGNAKHAAEFWFKNSYLLGNHISTGLMIYFTRGGLGHPKEYYCISKYDWKTLSVFVIWPIFSNSNDNSFYILFLLLPAWRRTLTV